jgi:electron transport complex protein RnfG
VLSCHKGGALTGYVVFASPKGYSGSVDIMVGFDTAGTLMGVQILSHAETPGLGANATKPSFLDQFKSKNGELTVTKAPPGENEIQAITSATITSTAMVRGVNEARTFFLENIGGGQIQ